jgi:hypothetical protein
MTPDELQDKLVAGLLHTDEQVPEFSASYRAMLARLREQRERDGREGS